MGEEGVDVRKVSVSENQMITLTPSHGPAFFRDFQLVPSHDFMMVLFICLSVFVTRLASNNA